MGILFGQLAGLLVIAAVVAVAARRLRLPYTVGLVLAGVGIALLGLPIDLALTHDVVLDVILPPLLFEAALNLHWDELRKDAAPILLLSTLGVIVSAAVAMVGMTWAGGWSLDAALIFGVLIAATDPVAVIAMFKDNGIRGRLRLLVESESLFNDGVTAVFFALALIWVTAHTMRIADGALTLVLMSGGGIAMGLACGGIALLLAGRTSDHLVEMTVTTAAAYASFLAADHLGLSGVLATVSAGLLIGTVGLHSNQLSLGLSEGGRAFVLEVWDFLAFLANSCIFILIGLTVARVPFASVGYATLALAVLIVLIGRAATVYPLGLLFSTTRWRIPLAQQHVLWWGGLRGALALALALSLPDSIFERQAILVVTFGVVAFSVICQGLTMPMLMRRLRIT